MFKIIKLFIPFLSLFVVGVMTPVSGYTQKKLGAFEVNVEEPKVEKIRDYIDANGRVRSSQLAKLVARVPGYLEEVNYIEGDFVQEGTILFQIEQDTYQQQLNLEKANLLKQEAEYLRQKRLIVQNATSVANVEKYQAQRDQAIANTELALINLDYTTVKAPFDGRVSRRLVDVGNYVGNSGTPTELATIQEVNPIYIYFEVSETDVLEIQKLLQSKGRTLLDKIDSKIPVFLQLQNEDTFEHTAYVNYIDTDVSDTTSTLEIRAIFDNSEGVLLPGYFARVRVPIGKEKEGMLLSEAAIGQDQQGYFVYIAQKNIAKKKYIERGKPMGPGMRHVISGIGADDQVIISGLSRVFDGAKVIPKLIEKRVQKKNVIK